MIETRYGDKSAGHFKGDSTVIDAREKVARKKREKPEKTHLDVDAITQCGRTIFRH